MLSVKLPRDFTGRYIPRVDPEVLYLAAQEVEMALLREYDTVAAETPYAISFGAPLHTTVRGAEGNPFLTWELADAVLCGFAKGLPDDEWRSLTATVFFESGRALVPVSVTRANGKAFSLMDAFFELVLDRSSPEKI